MIHHVVAISALTTFIGAAETLPANAANRPATVRRDGNHHGNGRHNRNIISSRSPVHNRGYQHTSNGNAGGTNPVQNALCRHVTVCHISQHVTIVQPERPAPPVPPAPAAVPDPPIEVLPQTVMPQSRPVVRARPRSPFMYMGADGFVLMAPGSSAGFGTGTGSLHLPFGFFG